MFMLNNGGAQAIASPDVCKVPTPAGPVPTPFVNMGTTQLAAPGGLVKKVLVVNMPALNQGRDSVHEWQHEGHGGGQARSARRGHDGSEWQARQRCRICRQAKSEQSDCRELSVTDAGNNVE